MENIFNNYYILLTAIFLFVVVSNFFLYKLITRKRSAGVYGTNVTDTQERITPKPGCRKYKLACRIECYQEELTWDQDVEVMNILAGLKLADILKQFKETKEIEFDRVVSLFREHGALERFMDIIMTVTYRPPGVKWKFYNSELRVIFTDFFTLNPESKMILEIMKLAAGIMSTQDFPQSTSTEEDLT